MDDIWNTHVALKNKKGRNITKMSLLVFEWNSQERLREANYRIIQHISIQTT